jgi:hypothetical protein
VKQSYHFIALMILCTAMILSISNCSSSNKLELNNTYFDDKFKFSVDYPSDWKHKINAYQAGTETHESSQNSGIDLFIDNNELNRFFIYGQISTVSLPFATGTDYHKFMTDSGLEGTLYIYKADGRVQLDYVIEDIWINAGCLLDSKIYDKNEKKIMNILKSIRVE